MSRTNQEAFLLKASKLAYIKYTTSSFFKKEEARINIYNQQM